MGFVELLLIAAEGFDFFSLFNRGLGLKAFIGGLRVRSVGCEAVEGLGFTGGVGSQGLQFRGEFWIPKAEAPEPTPREEKPLSSLMPVTVTPILVESIISGLT